MRIYHFTVMLSLACLVSYGLMVETAQSQSATSRTGASSRDAANVETFEAAFFSTYNPVTALDMVKNVPGFTLSDGDDRRGFGATAGNVLINGERPSSKSKISDQLLRIPAGNVLHIERTRGTTADADVRGLSEFVNVVLVQSEARPRTNLVTSLFSTDEGDASYAFQASRRVGIGPTLAHLDLQVNSNPFGLRALGVIADTDERVSHINGSADERKSKRLTQDFNDYALNTAFDWLPTRADTVRLNVRGLRWHYELEEQANVRDPVALIRREFIAVEEDEARFYEIGGDWEHRLSDTLAVKTVVLTSGLSFDNPQRFTTRASDGTQNIRRVSRFTEREERVGRMVWNWQPDEGYAFDTGYERAVNTRRVDLDVAVGNGDQFVPVALPVSNTVIKETRDEVFLTGVGTLGEALSVEATVAVESSLIAQTGDARQERRFRYVKPSASINYQLNPADRLRFSIGRDVAQLDFNEFASTVSLRDDTVDIGNPNLEPERTWRAEAEWEHRFGERGAVKLSGFYDRVDAVQDIVVIDSFSGPGNIDKGIRRGGRLAVSLPLDAVGIRQGLIKATGARQYSEVEDPLTGETRAFSGEAEWFYNLDFRQDLATLGLSWGLSYMHRDQTREFRADEVQKRENEQGSLGAFVETTRIAGFTLRFAVSNALDSPERLQREFYSGSRASGMLERIEFRERTFGPIFSLRLSAAL